VDTAPAYPHAANDYPKQLRPVIRYQAPQLGFTKGGGRPSIKEAAAGPLGCGAVALLGSTSTR